MKQLAIALALTAAAGSAFAQASVTSVTGMVTMSSGNQMISVTPGMAIPEGAQLLATSNGAVTLSFPSGCIAVLSAGQSMPATEAACQQNVAQRAQQPATGGGFLTPLNIAVGAGIGLGVAYNVHQNRKNNTPPTVTPPVQTPPVVEVRPPARPPISRS